MEFQKILNLWNKPSAIVDNQSNAKFKVENEIINYTEVLRPNLCDFNDAYILVVIQKMIPLLMGIM